MRFIHTADWHLGRSFYNISLIEDQALVLDQLIDLAKSARPDVLIIAGDVYDRAVPSTDAVRLLDETLSRLVLEQKLPVILIAGNHDSPHRLQFGARLMESLRLYIFGTVSGQPRIVPMCDSEGPVWFYPMPYAEPSVVRECLQNNDVNTHESAMRAWIDLARRAQPTPTRSVLICHAFVVGGLESESERPLSLGGSSTVAVECFADFNYIALGHLHRPQSLGNGQIHYSGSLLKYSFSEVCQSKSVNLVEMDGSGNSKIERIELKPKRDVRIVEGFIDDLINQSPPPETRFDFIQVRLLDKGAVFDAMGRLRDVYPNVVDIDRAGLASDISNSTVRRDHRRMDVTSLFKDFYEQVTGENITEEQAFAFASVADGVYQSEREATS